MLEEKQSTTLTQFLIAGLMTKCFTPLALVHLVWLMQPARTNTRVYLDKQGLPAGPERTEGVVPSVTMFKVTRYTSLDVRKTW
jgi:hypothetical protein